MYNTIWNKYLPVIRILLKRAVKEEQSFQLNSFDFGKTAPSRKSSISFTLVFQNGRPERLANLPLAAKDLTNVLLEDSLVRELFLVGEYHISMSKKLVLNIQCIPKVVEEAQSLLLVEDAPISAIPLESR